MRGCCIYEYKRESHGNKCKVFLIYGLHVCVFFFLLIFTIRLPDVLLNKIISTAACCTVVASATNLLLLFCVVDLINYVYLVHKYIYGLVQSASE